MNHGNITIVPPRTNNSIFQAGSSSGVVVGGAQTGQGTIDMQGAGFLVVHNLAHVSMALTDAAHTAKAMAISKAAGINEIGSDDMQAVAERALVELESALKDMETSFRKSSEEISALNDQMRAMSDDYKRELLDSKSRLFVAIENHKMSKAIVPPVEAEKPKPSKAKK